MVTEHARLEGTEAEMLSTWVNIEISTLVVDSPHNNDYFYSCLLIERPCQLRMSVG